MQTPKDKAIDLVDRFLDIYSSPDQYGGADKLDKTQAIKCAYACTEEIIMRLYDEGIREPQFWYDVQDELNKL